MGPKLQGKTGKYLETNQTPHAKGDIPMTSIFVKITGGHVMILIEN